MTRAAVLILIVWAGQTCAFADYLFTYIDNLGNTLGFVETSLQISGLQTSFLFASPGIAALSFDGSAPGSCMLPNGSTVLAQNNGCAAVQTGQFNQALSVYDAGVFDHVGTFSSVLIEPATIQVSQFSGYLFTYQDEAGDFVAFAEDTPVPSGTVTSFLFASPGITALSFDGNAPSSCLLPNGNAVLAQNNGCAAVQTGQFTAALSVYNAGVFGHVGTFSSVLIEPATIQIVAASAPEPSPLFTSTLGLLLALGRRAWVRWAGRFP